MSCDNSAFGYVEIKDHKVVSHTGDPANPTVHIFCNDEIVRAMKLLKLVTDRFEGERGVYNEEHNSPELKERAMDVATLLQGMLDESEIQR